MDDAQQYTPAQAADPSTPAEVLAAIAGSRPDLHPYLAANPSTYPALLEWLGQLGDPAVDAALQARESTAIVPSDGPGEGAGYLPPASAGQPWAEVTPQSTGSSSSALPQSYPASPYEAASPHEAATAHATASSGPPPGGPAPDTLAGQPVGYPFPAGDAGGRPGTSPFGAPAGSPYGPAAGQRPRGSRTWLWVLLALLAILVVGGTIVGILVVRTISDAANDAGTIFNTGEARDYGDDPALDALWDACAGGDMAACDDLYFEAPGGSEYEEFADTCGGRTDGGTLCRESDLGGAAAPVLHTEAHERAGPAPSSV